MVSAWNETTVVLKKNRNFRPSRIRKYDVMRVFADNILSNNGLNRLHSLLIQYQQEWEAEAAGIPEEKEPRSLLQYIRGQKAAEKWATSVNESPIMRKLSLCQAIHRLKGCVDIQWSQFNTFPATQILTSLLVNAC